MHREFSSHVEQLVTISSGSGKAPPLPPKKRHVKEYMAAVGQYSQPSDVEVELYRKTMEAYFLKTAQWQTHIEDQFSSPSNSYLSAPPPHPPPNLPPKRGRSSITSTAALALPESSPAPSVRLSDGDPMPSATPWPTPSIKAPPTTNGIEKADPESDNDEGMEQTDLSTDLVLKQPEDEGPEVRGGGLNALITHAAKLNKDDYLYQAAFLTTYRTFISPLELIRKLIHRYARSEKYHILTR